MKKCSFVRSDNNGLKKCPFGLPIIKGCACAGDSVSHMCPLVFVPEDKRDQVKKANARVYIYYKTGERCIYASNIMNNQDVVNCDFGDTAAGLGSVPFTGSPLYSQTFGGVGLDGLYAFPLGFYADNNSSRNLFQGLFSLVGEFDTNIIKNAGISKEIVEKLEFGNKLTTEEIQELIDSIRKCRNKFESNRTDLAKINEIASKWGY